MGITLPEFRTGSTICRYEIERLAHGRQPADADIGGLYSAARRTVATPQLPVAGSVIDDKIQHPAHCRETVRRGPGCSGVDVLDEDRAGGRAVAPPQLLAAGPVERIEVECAIYRRELPEI